MSNGNDSWPKPALVHLQPLQPQPPAPRTDFEDGEARIRDADLGAFLGFARPVNIRALIKSHSSVLGTIFTAQMVAGNRLTVDEAWLTEHQAIYIIAKSETPIANTILQQVINVFIEAKRGKALAPVAKAVSSTHAMLLAMVEHEVRLADLETRQSNDRVSIASTEAVAYEALNASRRIARQIDGLQVLVADNEPHMTAVDFCQREGLPIGGVTKYDTAIGIRASALRRREISRDRRCGVQSVVLPSVVAEGPYSKKNQHPIRLLEKAINELRREGRIP